MAKRYGILTSGGDTPGLNAAIRSIGKTLMHVTSAELIGFYDGFRGLAENRYVLLNDPALSGILIRGGTILGSSRDKPHRMPVNGEIVDMTPVIAENYRSLDLEGIFCLGGGGTQKNALRLKKAGMNVITLPKTIDNDIMETDVSFGYDTALSIATEAVDRLHSTAHSHHRIIIVETMGHNVGWLALGAGLAGGADVILLPEIPYSEKKIAAAISERKRRGKRFSIVAIAEGAMPSDRYRQFRKEVLKEVPADTPRGTIAKMIAVHNDEYRNRNSAVLAEHLEQRTGMEARVTILGHLQRGGSPTAYDRNLATLLGARAVDEAIAGNWGCMIAVRGRRFKPVAVEKATREKKYIPHNHPMVRAAKNIGIDFGD
jgi:ATP-dependent phosphofructokinase / diphosphate-dependent phosphofructokinase